MSLRIGILGTRGIPNHYGGFEQLTEYLAPGLVQAGHDVTVYNSHNHPYKEHEWRGVHIRHCYDPEHWMGCAGQFVYDLNCLLDARKRGFDVILQLGYTSSSVWWPLFPPGSLIIYNLDGLEWRRSKYSPMTRRFLRYAEKLAVKHSDSTIADSPVIQSYFREKYGIESEYIPYGAELFDHTDETPLQEYGLHPGEYFLLMSRMEPENNIEVILEGFCNSQSARKFLVVGNMSNRYGQHLVARFGHDKRVFFPGPIYDRQRIHCLKFFSRLYFHGHSTGGTNPSLLEAMASQALIAAHDNTFNREVLGGGAFYFSSSAEITVLVEKTGEREMENPAPGRGKMRGAICGREEEQMIRLNLNRISERFNWPSVISRYEWFILYSLFIFNNERNILYRRYSC